MSNPYLVCSDRELRALPTQWLLAERWEKVGSLLSDINFAEVKSGRISIDELIRDYTTALRLLPKDNNWLEKLNSINRGLDRQAHVLRGWNMQATPTFFLQQIRQIRNEAFAQHFYEWQGQAEIVLTHLKKPYLLERFPGRLNPAELRTLTGHGGSVTSVAMSTDGRLAVSASTDETLKVWDVATGRELRTLTGHRGSVTSVAMSADGRLAVSASTDKTLKVWDVATGHELRMIIAQSDSVNGVAMSADGQLAVSVSGDKTLKAWDVATGRELWMLMGHDDSVNSVAMSANGQIAITVSGDNKIKIWDVSKGRSLRMLTKHKFPVTSVALSPDGRLAFFTSLDYIAIWDVSTGCEIRTLSGHRHINSIALSADGQRVISAANDKSLKLRDVATGGVLKTLTGHSGTVTCVAISAHGQLVVSGSTDQTLKVWDVSLMIDDSFEANHEQRDINYLSSNIALSADGRLAIFGLRDKTIRVWDLEMGHELRRLTGHNKYVHTLSISADGRLAISAGGSIIKVWDVVTGHEVYSLRAPIEQGEIYEVVLSANSGLAAASVDLILDEVLYIWDVATKDGIFRFSSNLMVRVVQRYENVTFGANDHLVVASVNNVLKVWNMATGQQIQSLYEDNDQSVDCLAVSSKGVIAVYALSGNKSLKVCDILDGRVLKILRGHNHAVKSVALSADGWLAVSASEDQTIKVWNTHNGLCIASMSIGVAVEHCVISANGKIIIAGDNSGRIHFLELVHAEDLLPKDVKIEKSWLALKKESEQESKHGVLRRRREII